MCGSSEETDDGRDSVSKHSQLNTECRLGLRFKFANRKVRNLKIPNATLGCDELSLFLCFWRRKRAGFSNPAILGHSEHLSEVKKLGLYRRFSGMYWMSYTIAGKQHHESTGTHDKKLATKIVAVRAAEVAQGRHRIVPVKSPLLSAWADEFLSTIRETSTKKRYSSSIKHLNSFFHKARLAE